MYILIYKIMKNRFFKFLYVSHKCALICDKIQIKNKKLDN